MLDLPFNGMARSSYGVIAADPPWSFRSYAPPDQQARSRRDVEKHYPTMDLAAIKALPVRDIARRDAHLFLWVTGPQLPAAFGVIEAWGFRYSGVAFTWIKLKRSFVPNQLRMLGSADADFHFGLGFTTRKNAEFCLLARRGNARRIAKDVRELILSPVREHSRKPDEAFDRIRRYAEGPYLEMFSRESRLGWDAWGLETGKFDAGAA